MGSDTLNAKSTSSANLPAPNPPPQATDLPYSRLAGKQYRDSFTGGSTTDLYSFGELLARLRTAVSRWQERQERQEWQTLKALRMVRILYRYPEGKHGNLHSYLGGSGCIISGM